MPAAVAVPLILGGAAAGTSLYAASKQAGAAKDAAAQQQAAIARALPLMQEQASIARSDLAPYAAIGGQGLSSLAALAGLSSAPAGGWAPVGRAAGTMLAGGPGGMVTVRAPTGQTRAVPADQVAFYLARGATQV